MQRNVTGGAFSKQRVSAVHTSPWMETKKWAREAWCLRAVSKEYESISLHALITGINFLNVKRWLDSLIVMKGGNNPPKLRQCFALRNNECVRTGLHFSVHV